MASYRVYIPFLLKKFNNIFCESSRVIPRVSVERESNHSTDAQ